MDSDSATIPSAVSTAVNSAVSALVKYKAKQQSSTDKLQLLPQDDFLYLNLTLKKIPSKSRTNPFRISLPHPILDATSELCLIIDDRANTPTPPSDQIKKLIKAQEIPISKVLKVSKLKANYKAFEQKRKLCDSYDMFLADKRIVHLLPKLLGKEFFKKKKLPLGVDLGKQSFKAQVERALGSALLYMRTGTCCVMKVGKADMEEGEIVENVVEAVKGAVENVPRKWDGVRSLHLKFSDSVALPVYQAMPDVTLKVKEEGEEKSEAVVAKASDTEGEAKVGKSGKKKKGRIHEVKYMDVDDGIDDIVGEVELIDEDLDVEENLGKKRKAGKKDKKKKVEGEESVAKKPKKTELADGGVDTAEKKGKKKKSEEVAVAKVMTEQLETVHKKGKKKIENVVEEKSGEEKKGKKKNLAENQMEELNSGKGKKAKKGEVEVVKELGSGEEKKSNKKKSKAEKVNELKSGEKKHSDKKKGEVEEVNVLKSNKKKKSEVEEVNALKSGDEKKSNKKKKKSEVEEVNALKSGEEKKSNKKKRELGEEITESKSGEKKARKKSKKEIDEPVTEVKVAKQKKRVSTK